MYVAYGHEPKRHKKKFLLALFTLMLIGLVGVGFAKINSSKDVTPVTNTTKPAVQEPKQSEYEKLEGRYLFAGTIVLARAVEKYAYGNYDQPFSKMHTFGNFDSGMADLECPVTSKNVSYEWQIANTVFNCRPEWLPTLKKYFPIVNLAANHAHDMGAEGFPEALRHLEKAGIQAVGNYSPRVKDDICEVVGLTVRLKKPDGSEAKGTLPMAFCAWHYFSFTPEAGEIETMDRYAKVMPVFAFMHAGAEYLPKAGAEQTDIAHRIIDRGPEFLIGNSPHWVQNTEVYKGKLIVYSTGNFIFDQIDYETMRGLSIGVNMSVPYDDNVAKWLALGESCKPEAREDKCLEAAEQQGLSKIKLSLKYEALGNTSGVRKITEKADPTLQKAIEERANWQASMKALGQ